MTPLIMMMKMMETSTSALDTLKTCPKKYEYNYVRGLQPKSSSSPMMMGTHFHAAAAEGYRRWQAGDKAGWLEAAKAECVKPDPVDRFDRPYILGDEEIQDVLFMLEYYWEHVGSLDDFSEIISVEEPVTIIRNGMAVRGTMDLVVRELSGQVVIYDHKTSGDINGDMAHLPLDLQTHNYYLFGRELLGERPKMFVHNFMARFNSRGKQRLGPPQWSSGMTGTRPFALTESGKIATRSSDPNDYVRRVRTVLSDRQLDAFEKELSNRLMTLRFHTLSEIFPRSDTKLGFGCASCPYYALCTTEMDGKTINPQLLDMLFDVDKHA